MTTDYLSFRVGGQWYGLPVADVIRVLHMVALDELPRPATPDVLGLLTLAERVMPVVDLRRRFQVSSSPLSLQTPLIALDTPTGPLALVVDDVDRVLPIPDAAIADYNGRESAYVRAAARQDSGLLLLLDPTLLHSDPHSN